MSGLEAFLNGIATGCLLMILVFIYLYLIYWISDS